MTEKKKKKDVIAVNVVIVTNIGDTIRKMSLTDEFCFGFLRSEGMHGRNLTHTEGVDLFNVTPDVVLLWQVLFYLPT